MNKQYEKLRQVIIAANPEIVELKFGCEFSLAGTIHKIISIAGDEGEWSELLSIRQPYTDVVGIPKKITNQEFSLFKTLDILGRPIRLADVLLALRKTNLRVAISDEGIFFVKNSLQKLGEWNLHHDNLDHQSEETKQFLISLLVK